MKKIIILMFIWILLLTLTNLLELTGLQYTKEKKNG
jgi:hypothetical protein